MMSNTITKARITYPDLGMSFLAGGIGKVEAQLGDSEEWVELFTYYTDELHFSEREFVGLTTTEAHKLRHDRDVAYLQS